MVGKHLFVKDGEAFLRDLARLKVPGLYEQIHHRRVYEPLEGVQIRPLLWSDEVAVPGAVPGFRYLFIKGVNKVFLLRVSAVAFTPAELTYFAELAAKFA